MRKISNDLHCNLKQSSSWNKDRNVSLKSKLRQEKWLRRQQEQEHGRQKRKMILEYEMQREQNQNSKVAKKKFLHVNRRTCTSCTISKATLILECKDSSHKMLPKCSEYTQIIGSCELHRIRIDIHRNSLSKSVSCKLRKDINDPEDALVGRKSGEVFKPIRKSNDFKKSIDRKSSSRLQAVRDRVGNLKSHV